MTDDAPILTQRAELLEAIRQTFDSPHGQLCLAWLHATAATRKPAFIAGKGAALDPLAAAMRDGRKSLVWEIEANLEHARASYGSTDAAHKPATRGRHGRRQQGA